MSLFTRTVFALFALSTTAHAATTGCIDDEHGNPLRRMHVTYQGSLIDDVHHAMTDDSGCVRARRDRPLRRAWSSARRAR